MDAQIKKQNCRVWARTVVNELSSRGRLGREKAGQDVARQISTLVPKGARLGVFVPRADEVEYLTSLSLSDYQCVYPAVDGLDLSFYSANYPDDFEIGAFGISEPMSDRCKEVALEEIDFMLVPGMAFDRQYSRLGRGKGYYDRALSQFKGAKVGVCLVEQISKGPVPTEEHDVKMDYLVTDQFFCQRWVG